MGKRTAEITLDGETYKVHAFNVGELERIVGGSAWTVVQVALERGVPPVAAEEFMKLEPTLPELNAAAQTLMRLAGMDPLPAAVPGAAP
jgi:hypothetical protein